MFTRRGTARRSRTLIPVLAVAAGVAALLTALPVGARADTADTGAARPGSCLDVAVPVAGGAVPAGITLAGTLCTPAAWAEGPRTVDLLVHGGMYNREYWDWPVDPADYSYVDRTLAAGRATFAYDRIGVGDSTHPAAAADTFAADVDALHQLVQWLRGSYPVVDLIGHSLGSVIAVQEAGAYRDVDRLVVTGLTHGHGLGFLLLPATIWTASLDPEFRYSVLPPNSTYVTTRPGQRKGLFYSASADPAVIAWDEAHKDVMSVAETTGAITALTLLPGSNVSDRVTAPVLLVLGRQDAPFCNVDVDCSRPGTVLAHEAPYYAGAASVTAQVVPDTGHDLPLHPSAGVSFAGIDAWIATH